MSKLSAFIGAGGGGFLQYDEFTSSGIWTKHSDAKIVYVELVGGGGDGPMNGGGGGGGGYADKTLLASAVSSSVTITVGAGGGGTSSFGSYAHAKGGETPSDSKTGGNAGDGTLGGYQTSVSGPYIAPASSYAGGGGGIGNVTYAPNTRGGDSVKGGAGGGGGTPDAPGLGGISIDAGNGGNYKQNGEYPGGGGGVRGGKGAAGRVRVWQFA